MALKILIRVLLSLALLVFTSGGGFLFRLANGWIPIPQYFGENDFFYNSFHRLIFAVPTGLLVFLASRRVHGVVLAVVVFVSIYFSLYINWGTLRDASGTQSASGVFDWIVGTDDLSWPFWRRWLREYTQYCLRGLLMTAVPGFFLYCYNYGTQFFITGALSGVAWTLGSAIRSNVPGFETGDPLSQFIWGWWLWLVLSVVVLCYRHQHPKESFVFPMPIDSSHNSQRWRRAVMVARIVCNLLLLFIIAVLVTCTVYYTFVMQDDMRAKEQNWIGLVVQSGSLCLLFLIYVICKVILHRVMARHDCPEPEARTEMMDALKCCCKPKRTHKRGSFFYPADDSDSDNVGPLLVTSVPTSTTHIQEYKKEKKLMDNEPAKPWRYLLYFITVIDWLAVVVLLPLCVYVPYTDAYPGSWHL